MTPAYWDAAAQLSKLKRRRTDAADGRPQSRRVPDAARTNGSTRTAAGVRKPEEKEPVGSYDVMVVPPSYGDCDSRTGRADVIVAASNAIDVAGWSMGALKIVVKE